MAGPEKHTDAGSQFLNQIDEAESLKAYVTPYIEFLNSSYSQFKTRQARLTDVLIGLTILVFIGQTGLFVFKTESFPEGILYVLIQPGALTGLNAWLFTHYTVIAWILSSFIHKGLIHFGANIALLALFGKLIEPKFQTRYFLLWFLAVTVIVKPIDAFITLSTNPEPNVAVYGISDFVYALAVYSLFDLIHSSHRTELQYFGGLIGFAAVLDVFIQLANAAAVASVHPINFSHLIGGLLGLMVFGFLRYSG